MEIFKHNIKFNSWGEIYAGLKRDFIGAEKLAEFSKEENIVVYKENRFLKFSVGNYTSTYDVLEIIRTFSKRINIRVYYLLSPIMINIRMNISLKNIGKYGNWKECL